MIYIYLVPQMPTALYYMHRSLVCIVELAGKNFFILLYESWPAGGYYC
jgi:hypothetical protein